MDRWMEIGRARDRAGVNAWPGYLLVMERSHKTNAQGRQEMAGQYQWRPLYGAVIEASLRGTRCVVVLVVGVVVVDAVLARSKKKKEKEKRQERGESGVVYIQRSYATGCPKGEREQAGTSAGPRAAASRRRCRKVPRRYRAGHAPAWGGRSRSPGRRRKSPELASHHPELKQAGLVAGAPAYKFVFKHSCPALLRGTRPCLSCSPVSPSICTRPRFDTRKLDYASCWQPSPVVMASCSFASCLLAGVGEGGACFSRMA